MILVIGNASPSARHASLGGLRCPECGGAVAPHGFARPRAVRTLDSVTELRPRRARCIACTKTHVVLPGEVVPRRRDAAAVIGRALLRRATGSSTTEIARELGRSCSTVRNWLRRFADNADALLAAGRRALLTYDANADPTRCAFPGSRRRSSVPSRRSARRLGRSSASSVPCLPARPPGASPAS